MQTAPNQFELRTESDYASEYVANLGANCGKLVQLYGVQVATKALRAKGAQVRRQVLANGKINVIGVLA